MYESFYGLKEKPFNLNPDPDYLYMSEGHENTLTHLQYAIGENKGFVVVTGEIGAGKTTLLNYLLGEIPSDIDVGLINNTHVPASQFIKLVCREFEIDIAGLDRTAMIDRFHDFLLDMYTERKRVVLIVDEAQNLNPKTLEEIRLLSNLESEKHHLLQIILVGQPELKLKLQRPDLQQLAQRVTVHCHLKGLNEADVANYICYRLEVAGEGDKGKCDLFDSEAIGEIREHSNGIPRLINIICDTALVFGYADSAKKIGAKIIRDVVKERTAGGLFTPSNDNDPANESGAFSMVDNHVGPHATGMSGVDSARVNALQTRVDDLTERLIRVESALEKATARLSQKWDYRSQRDDIMIELFKMLRKSMDRRLETLLRVSSINK